jgi:hypothetical protein
MKSNNKEQTRPDIINEITTNQGITRKQAIKRMGKYAAITALGSYIILNPQKAQAQSASPPDAGGDPLANPSAGGGVN